MLQRAMKAPMTPARQALKLLEMRDEVRAALGDQYTASTAPFRPFIATAMQQLGCPLRAAAHVVGLLDTQQQNTEAKKLVTCAALDLALEAA